MSCERAQDLRELVGTELAGSATPRGERRQPDLLHSGLLSRSIVEGARIGGRGRPRRQTLHGYHVGEPLVMVTESPTAAITVFPRTSTYPGPS